MFARTTLAALLALAILAAPAQAETLHAHTLDDTASDGTCDATCTVRDAVEDAGAGDTVELVAGEHLLNNRLAIERSVTLVGARARSTILRQTVDTGVVLIQGNDDPQPLVTMTGLTITDGFADTAGGGIVMVGPESATLVLDGVTVSDNTARLGGAGGNVSIRIGRFDPIVSGGGVNISPGSTLRARNSTFAGNRARGSGDDVARGGAIANNAGTLELVNSTVSDNSVSDSDATGQGGGVASINGQTRIVHSTLAQNSADAGGNVWAAGGSTSLAGTILADGDAADGPNCHGEIDDDGGNLDTGASCEWEPGGKAPLAVGDDDGASVNDADVRLGPLVDNGGPTDTRRPAVDGDAPDLVVTCGGPLFALTRDQRGGARPLGGACDSGAVELGAPVVSGLGADGARVSATVDPRLAATTWRFEYGTTTAYGSVTSDASLAAGAGPTAVAADLPGLAPGTTYHFRAVATSAEGTTVSDDAAFTTPTPGTPPQQGGPQQAGPQPLPPTPVLSALRMRPTAFRAGARATILYRLAGAPAKVSFKFEKLVRRGRRKVWKPLAGGVERSGRIGSNSFVFRGRLNGKPLAAGRYRLVAALSGVKAPRVRAGFRIRG